MAVPASYELEPTLPPLDVPDSTRNQNGHGSDQAEFVNLGYPRPHFLVNEHGIVIPPTPRLCMGSPDCSVLNEDRECGMRRHHNQSGKPGYEQHGGIAPEFRNLPHLTTWVPECWHRQDHATHNSFTRVPSLNVMERCIKESRILSEIDETHGTLLGIGMELERRGPHSKNRRFLTRALAAHVARKREQLTEIDQITFLPEEIVTGSLLWTAPRLARRRVMEGSGIAFVGSFSEFNPQLYDEMRGLALHFRLFPKPEEEVVPDSPPSIISPKRLIRVLRPSTAEA